MTYTSDYPSPLGAITLASDGQSLTGLWFDGQKYFGSTLQGETLMAQPDLHIFRQTRLWLDIYFGGEEPRFTPQLRLQTSPFRRLVWQALLSIPYGQTRTYADIARIVAPQMGLATMSAQAVGGAVGHNPISIIIPCHRIVGSDGSLTGYAGGIDRKQKLLLLEHAFK